MGDSLLDKPPAMKRNRSRGEVGYSTHSEDYVAPPREYNVRAVKN
jgi:hypothetical protein